jgi:preprotein translocase subunit SecY
MGLNFLGDKSTSRDNLVNRILLTLGIILFARLGTFIPLTGIDQKYLYTELQNSPILNFFSSFSQGDFFVLGPFTLGILPNINASISMQLLTAVLPFLQKLQKEEGVTGQKKVTQYTRYLTVVIAFIYGCLIAFFLKPFVFGWNLVRAVEIALTLTTGSIIILWLSELITEKGIGNGTSLFIFVNISSALPKTLNNFTVLVPTLPLKLGIGFIFAIGLLSIVVVQGALRKIDLLSVKSLLRESSNSQSSYLPFRLNPSGIMPLIFSSGLLNVLIVGINKISLLQGLANFSNLIYTSGYFILTLFFSYFYSTIAIKPSDLSDNLKKMNFTIPGVQPGLATMRFLQETLTRLALLGGLFLAIIVTIPSLLAFVNPAIKGFGITSLIILVGVAVDLSRQIRFYLISEVYDNINL